LRLIIPPIVKRAQHEFHIKRYIASFASLREADVTPKQEEFQYKIFCQVLIFLMLKSSFAPFAPLREADVTPKQEEFQYKIFCQVLIFLDHLPFS
jgi:hypothetical protein